MFESGLYGECGVLRSRMGRILRPRTRACAASNRHAPSSPATKLTLCRARMYAICRRVPRASSPSTEPAAEKMARSASSCDRPPRLRATRRASGNCGGRESRKEEKKVKT